MYIKCKGLIIKETDTGEKGKLLTILTANKGVIHAKAAGGKNVGASYFRCVQLFTYCEFHMYSGHNPGYLTILDALYIRSFFNLSKDIQNFALAAYCAELCKISFVGGNEDSTLLQLLLNTFHTIENNSYPHDHVKAVFEMRLAGLLGFAPLIDECDCCGKPLPSEETETYFDIEQGSIRCKECLAVHESKANVYHISAAVYRSVLHSLAADKDKLFSFKTDSETLRSFAQLSEKYILCRLEYEPKALPLYKSFKMEY